MSYRTRITALSFSLSLIFVAAAHAGPREDAQAENAVRVLAEIQAIPESAIPDKLLDEAKAIVIVPDTIKAGLVLGGRRGHGVLAVRTADGGWSNPGFITLTGGSIGLQVGVQSADVVLVFRSERGLDSIVNGKFTLGADAGVAAGPMGRNASASTDGQMKAEIWSWSRARGLFAGVALDGAVLSMDNRANEAVYGQDTTPRMIFEGRAQQEPSPAIAGFRSRLAEASASARAARADDEAAPPPVTGAQPVDATTTAVPTTAEPQPQPFQAVENPAKVEALPATP
ncbi:MAG: lipid-binding SYLF domain-containing protein [Lysobacteraceae bacterium]